MNKIHLKLVFKLVSIITRFKTNDFTYEFIRIININHLEILISLNFQSLN